MLHWAAECAGILLWYLMTLPSRPVQYYAALGARSRCAAGLRRLETLQTEHAGLMTEVYFDIFRVAVLD